MLAKSFAAYSQSRQAKPSSDSVVKSGSTSGCSPLQVPSAQSTSSALPSLGIVAERLRPDAATRRLIGLLSADCELTHSELEHIISYLKFRQTALVSRALSPDSSSGSHGHATDRGGRTADDSTHFGNSLMLEVAKLAGRP